MTHAAEVQDRSGMFRRMTWLLGAAIFVIIGIVVFRQLGMVEHQEERTIDKLLAQFEAAGLRVGKLTPLTNSAGAMRAVEAAVQGSPVRIYHFNVSDPRQREALKQIQEHQAIDADGKPEPALVNGPFVMTGYEGNASEAELQTLFKAFGTFEGQSKENKTPAAGAK